MHIIVCVDDAGGMLFNRRRQSKDQILRQRARELAKGQPLWMNSYTAGQFVKDGYPMMVDENFLGNAPQGAWCFVENMDVLPFFEKIESVTVFRWNRLYPSDVTFPETVFAQRWHLEDRKEFAGKSHDKITQEVYRL